MKLSELNPTPLYDVTVPSTGKKVKFRPFFVKEERALLAAYESEDSSVMLNTLLMIVKNCIVPEQKNLTAFDIEFLFLQIRAKSVGELSSLNFTCAGCAEKIPMNIDIRSAEVSNLGESMNLHLSESLTLKMRYPSIDDIMAIENETDEHAVSMMVISAAIETIFSGSESIDVRDEPAQELLAFIERLTAKQYAMLEEFIKNTPTVHLNIDWTCPKCKHSNQTHLKGLTSFF
jgi:hypothetical protein